jgi:hypothetical protein
MPCSSRACSRFQMQPCATSVPNFERTVRYGVLFGAPEKIRYAADKRRGMLQWWAVSLGSTSPPDCSDVMSHLPVGPRQSCF